MSSNLSDLIETLVTKQEVNQLLEQTEVLKDAIYRSGGKDFKSTLASGVSLNLSTAIAADIGASESMFTDAQEQKKLLDELEVKLKSLPVVNLELAWEPSKQFVSKIVEKLTEIVGMHVVVQISIDPQIMGGAKVINGGKFCDWTIANLWPDIWKEVEMQMGGTG